MVATPGVSPPKCWAPLPFSFRLVDIHSPLKCRQQQQHSVAILGQLLERAPFCAVPFTPNP